MLSLLDILFPDATMKLVKTFTPMKTIQPSINLWDRKEKYNGWSDWTTWNCALWIGGDEGFYNLAKDYRNYGDFVNCIKEIYMDKTPDGAKWDEADFGEMQEMMDEL